MKKIILISLLLIILAVGGFFAYLSQMDWNTQKEKLSAQMSEIIGKKIQFSGDLQVKLFPQPQLSADNVNILNPQNGEKLATIKQLQTEVSLSSILKRRPDIKSLSLKELEAWVTFDAAGNNNWKQKNKQDSYTGGTAFSLQNFDIQKAIVHFNHRKYDVAFDLTGFNADVTISGVDGPYRLDGTFLKDNIRYGVVINLDSSSSEDSTMDIVISHKETESFLRYDGSYNSASESFNGIFTGQSQKTADFVNGLLNKEYIREEFNNHTEFSTALQFDGNENKLSDLVIKSDNLMVGSGNVIITAAAKNKKNKVKLKYQFAKFNLLPFEDMFKEYFISLQEGGKYEPDLNFDMDFDISSEKVTISKESLGTFETVGIKGEVKNNVLSIDDFYAGCPGNITLGLKARLSEKENIPQYYLEAKINGQNALSFLNSFGIKIKSPRQSSYRDIDLTFDLTGTPQFLNIENIDLKMDKAEIQGNIFADLLKKEYSVVADADILNLDNYMLPTEKAENATIEETVISEIKRFNWLINNKVTAVITAGSATFNGVSARNIIFDFITDGNGTAVAEEVSLQNMFSTDITLSGVVKNLGRSDLIFEDVTYDIKSSNIKMLADKLKINLPKWPLLERAGITESGTLIGNLQKIHVNSLTSSGEHSFLYSGILQEENEKINFSGNIHLKTGHTENLIKLLTDNVSGKVYRGPLTATAEISGNSDTWDLKKAEIQMGMDEYKANLNISKDKKKRKIVGSIFTSNLNLLNWINVQKTKSIPKFSAGTENTFIARPNFSGDVINYGGYRDFALDIDLSADKSSYGEYSMNNLQTHISNDHNLLRFQNLQFENKSHKLKGELQIDYTQTPQLQGNITVNYPKIKNLGGTTYSINAEDITIQTEFNTLATTIADMINGLNGKMKISGGKFTIKGINLAGIKEDLKNREYSKGLYKVVKENTESGETDFEGFNIETLINNAVFSLSPSTIKNYMAEVNINGSVNLKEWKINNSFKVTYPELNNIPSYTITFSGMLNKPTVDIDIAEIVNKYDKHWKEIEEERRKQQEILKKQQAEKVNNLRNLLTAAEEKVTKALQEVEEIQSKHLTQGIVDKYDEKIQQINDIDSHLKDIKALLSTDLTDEDIRRHNDDINGYSQRIDDIKSGLQGLFTEDIQSKKDELSARENEIYEKVKDTEEKFQNMWQKDREQLESYNSSQYIDANDELNRNFSRIRENKEAADNIHEDIEGRYAQFDVPDNWEEKHALAKSIENLIDQEENLYAQMQDIHKKTAEKLLKIIDERRIVFDTESRQREAERQKQAAIDAKNLLLNNTPSSAVESRNNDNDTSAQANNIPSQEQTPNIITTPNVRGTIITKYDRNKQTTEPTVRHSGGLLTPIDDDAPVVNGNSSVSGTIRIK